MHKARFVGQRQRLIYRNQCWSSHLRYDSQASYEVYSFWANKPFNPWEDDHLIYEGELDEPILVAGQKIYLHTLNQSVTVSEVLRSTSGVYTYVTDHVIEQVEDEETFHSKEEAEKTYNLYNETLPRGEVPGTKKPWWKRLFA